MRPVKGMKFIFSPRKGKAMIKAILVDSGGVLNGPVTGHWMITPNFFDFVDQKIFRSISKKRRRDAFRKAMGYIEKIPVMKTLDEEYTHFLRHYEIIFECLPEIAITKEGIEAITRDLVYNAKKYRFFEDAIAVIPELSKGFDLAVVSDAWPSLRRVFMSNDFMGYFKSFIVSCDLGTCKPDKRMYHTAIEALGLEPKEVVFVDDRLKNCDGARDAGILNTYLMCRSNFEYWFSKITVRNHFVVKNFHQVKAHLKSMPN